MKLNLYLSIFFLSLFPLFVQAQDTKPLIADERLYEVYEEDYVDKLLSENPFLIQRWNFYLDNAYYIADKVDGKSMDAETIRISDLGNINILKLEKELNIGKSWDLPAIYKIENSDKLLVYHPGKKFNERLKAHLGRE